MDSDVEEEEEEEEEEEKTNLQFLPLLILLNCIFGMFSDSHRPQTLRLITDFWGSVIEPKYVSVSRLDGWFRNVLLN